ncbi:hypothetical protein AB0J80_27595 [Actinoplanes sp. NPDC049548]|uniref:hypothetical protein n=1 Tax=Actinoplanes sp. NPDC049548 TaxID=3155152 RepID=UPI00342C257E
MSRIPRTHRRESGRGSLFGALLALILVATCVGGLSGFGYVLGRIELTTSDHPDPFGPPDDDQVAAAVAELSRASTADGVCYGWFSSEDKATYKAPRETGGSNLGATIRASGAPSCPRWAEVQVGIRRWSGRGGGHHTKVRVRSGGLGADAPSTADLAAIGFDEDDIDWRPSVHTVRAALALPLLVREKRGQAAVTVPVAPVAAPAQQLPAVDGDLLRDRFFTLLLGLALTLVGAIPSAVAARGIWRWTRKDRYVRLPPARRWRTRPSRSRPVRRT